MPPYSRNPSDLGSTNVPGLPRLESCTFTGEYPMARIDFEDAELPVECPLEAFTPLIPHWTRTNPGCRSLCCATASRTPAPPAAKVSIAWSIENPIGTERDAEAKHPGHGRQNDYRESRE